MKKIDLTGCRFARLVVLGQAADHVLPCGQVQRCWQCLCDCGRETVVSGGRLQSKNTRSCGCLQREIRQQKKEKSTNYKGGKHKNSHGYVILLNPIFPGHEKYKHPYVPEHIVVIARYLGRALRPGETIHHKNGHRDDNRLENLELWASGHQRGQRVSDLVIWAKEILQRYDHPIVSPCCV